jgi:hypothetical protein
MAGLAEHLAVGEAVAAAGGERELVVVFEGAAAGAAADMAVGAAHALAVAVCARESLLLGLLREGHRGPPLWSAWLGEDSVYEAAEIVSKRREARSKGPLPHFRRSSPAGRGGEEVITGLCGEWAFGERLGRVAVR